LLAFFLFYLFIYLFFAVSLLTEQTDLKLIRCERPSNLIYEHRPFSCLRKICLSIILFSPSGIDLATCINSVDVYRFVVVFGIVLALVLFPVFSITSFSFQS
jgi:hypothetical protein